MDMPVIYKNNERETCFNYSYYKGNNNLKEIFNAWNIFIDQSINYGNSHFAITINIPDSFNYKKYSKYILKKKPVYFSKEYRDEHRNFYELSTELFFEGPESCLRLYIKDIWVFY